MRYHAFHEGFDRFLYILSLLGATLPIFEVISSTIPLLEGFCGGSFPSTGNHFILQDL
jgi:hypothetical protein